MTSASERFSASSRRDGRGSRLRASARAIAACVLLAAMGGVAPSRAIEEEDIAGQLARYGQLFQQGKSHLDDLDFAEAINAFGQILDAYKTGQIPMVTPDAHTLVAKSFEGRALAFANLGKNAEATADFEALVRFDPSYQINLTGISPKIIKLYTGVRRKVVGVVSVETDPLGAEVKLGDQSLGPTPVADREVVSGTYRLEISKAGFDPIQEDVEVEAGGRLERKLKLVPNARSVRVSTTPRDVKILVDGTERGSTFGTAGAEFEQVAGEMGLSLADISEPLLVENLTPGHHEILLRKDCYQDVVVPITIEVNPENNAPVTYKPFILEPSRGKVEIASQPPGADVTLDGKPAGKAPVSLEGICSGKHDLSMVSEGIGRYSGTITVRKDETTTASFKLRLSLVVFDMRDGIAPDETLGALLRRQNRYNVLTGPPDLPSDLAERVRLEVESAAVKGLSETTLAELRSRLTVEMAVLLVPVGSLGTHSELILYGPSHPQPDRWEIDKPGREGMDPVLTAMGADAPSTAAWTGLKLIDVYGTTHPVVLSIEPGSPAEGAGVKPGDTLLTVADAPVAGTAGFLSIVRGAEPGDSLVLGIERDGVAKQVSIRCAATPVILPMSEDGILYNKAIADLSQQAALAPDPETKSYALLSKARAFMHFGLWDKAIRECLRNVVLPDGPGISRGTAAYLTALCYEKLKMSADARSSYEIAAASGEATLFSNDGPKVAPSARRRAAALASVK